jgi:hypothetical protein
MINSIKDTHAMAVEEMNLALRLLEQLPPDWELSRKRRVLRTALRLLDLHAEQDDESTTPLGI